MKEHKIKVAIVDNETKLISIIKKNLLISDKIDIVYTATNGKEAIEALEKNIPDVILMDINMPGINGIETTKYISTNFTSIKVIMLTVMDAENIILESILAGAAGYLTKDSPSERIIEAIIECLEGGAPMSPGIAFKAMQLIKQNTKPKNEKNVYEEFGLTKREIEILEKIATGNTYKQIGDELNISPSTVRKHIENIYAKLRVHNKTEALNLAKRKDII
jgi:DNA-binding NarL/FixJ family response regulator